MKPLLLLALLLAGCQSAPTQARKIMEPVKKEVRKAAIIAERQRGSIGRIRGSVAEATAVADRLDRERPNADTARLLLSLRAATSEIGDLSRDNERLTLTLTTAEAATARAEGKVAEEITSAQGWKKWAWRWFGAFSGLAAGVAAMVYFRQSIPFLKFL